MESQFVLTNWNEAKRAIEQARTIDEVKDIRDKAEALRLYSRQAGETLEVQNAVAEIKIRAERRAGELLAEIPRESGARPDPTLGSGYAQALKNADLAPSTAHNWQRIASLPEQTFEEHIATTKAAGDELTSAGALRLARKLERQRARPVLRKKPENAAKSPLLIHGIAEATGLPDDNVDLIITSPPYNLGAESWPMGGDGRVPRDNGIGYKDNRHEVEYQTWQLAVLKELYRVAREGASLFYNHKVRQRKGELIHPLDWLRNEDNPWTLRQEIIWDRGSTHNHNPYLFWPHDERIYWLTKGLPTLPDHSINLSTIWQFHGPRANTWHPAPFPEDLPRLIIEVLGRPNITVLDPFAGSCTTIRVALAYGLDAIGIDINLEYLERAKQENGWE